MYLPRARASLVVVITMSKLPNDTVRCNGVSSVEDGQTFWREGCETCLRRTAPRPKRVWMMNPPAIIAFECEFLVEPPPISRP